MAKCSCFEYGDACGAETPDGQILCTYCRNGHKRSTEAPAENPRGPSEKEFVTLSARTSDFGLEEVVAAVDDGLHIRRRYKNALTGDEWRFWEDSGISLTAEEASLLLHVMQSKKAP